MDRETRTHSSAPLAGLGALALATLLAGCAGGGTGTRPGESPFPSPQALAELSRLPEPGNPLEADRLDVDRYTLEGALATRIGVTVRQHFEPFEQSLVEAARQRAGLVVLSEELHCTARALGRFWLEHEALPTSSLHRFMLSRCGSPAANPGMTYLHGTIPGTPPDAVVLEQWSEQTAGLIDQALAGRGRLVGLWFGREAERAVIMVTWSERLAVTSEIAVVPDATGMTLDGQLLEPAARLSASFTSGPYGVEDCEPDPDVSLPRFSFHCAFSPDDERAWLQLNAWAPGRILGVTLLDALVFPGGRASSEYVRSAVAAPDDDVSGDDQFERAAFEAINRVRVNAGQPALRLAREQSATSRGLVERFLQAQLGQASPLIGDTIALGVLAGWDVDEAVLEGRFAFGFVPGTTELGRWLSLLLEYPSSRRTLLDPSADLIALGTRAFADGTGLAALVGTYTLFDATDHDTQVERVLELLAARRLAQGLGKPEPLEVLSNDLARARLRVERGEVEPQRARRDLLRASSRTLGRSVQGWVFEASRLEDLPFGPDLVAHPSSQVAIAVVHREVGGQPWGRFVVLVVVPSTRDVVTLTRR